MLGKLVIRLLCLRYLKGYKFINFVNNPVKLSCLNLANIFLARLARSCTKIASLELKMKLFLQDMKNLARILQEKFAIIFSCKILIKSCKKFILQFFLARFLYLARKASFLVQDLQFECKILQVLQEKYLQKFHISFKTVFTGEFRYTARIIAIE